MSNITKKALKITGIIISLYIGICVYISFIQTDLMFFPAKKIPSVPNKSNLKEVYFTTSDNIKLNGWYITNSGSKTVLFFHGNGGNMYYNEERLRIFNELGVNALMIDYRGYGKSEGTMKQEEDIYTDGESAYQYLLGQGIPSESIIIWGQSLGGAVAIHTAQGKHVFGTIAESTFTTMDEMARETYWFLPVKYMMLRYHFPSETAIQNIISPILVIHSPDDEIIPFEKGKRLFEKAKAPKSFLETRGSHNGGLEKSYPLYLERIKEFISENQRDITPSSPSP